MKNLTAPSRVLGARIVKKVPFEDRFIGYSLSERHGAIRITSYSFQEVVNLLRGPMPRIDFNALVEWVGRTFGDSELAEYMAEAVQKGTNDHARVVHLRKLMEERLGQCRDIV